MELHPTGMQNYPYLKKGPSKKVRLANKEAMTYSKPTFAQRQSLPQLARL
jgi:hypothetical protein